MKPFQHRPDMDYAPEDVVAASTLEELHLATWGRAMHGFMHRNPIPVGRNQGILLTVQPVPDATQWNPGRLYFETFPAFNCASSTHVSVLIAGWLGHGSCLEIMEGFQGLRGFFSLDALFHEDTAVAFFRKHCLIFREVVTLDPFNALAEGEIWPRRRSLRSHFIGQR